MSHTASLTPMPLSILLVTLAISASVAPAWCTPAPATVTLTAPTVSISANPTTVESGGRSIISYTIDHATYCTGSADGASSGGALNGSKITAMKSTNPLTATSVFSFQCSGPGGTASQSATVTVTAPAATPPIGAAPTGDAALSWSAPTTNTNGTQVTPLTGYHVYYGTSPTAMTHTLAVSGATADSCEITGLAPGTWYFAVAADAADGTESAQSAIGSITI